jgi:hypothetical protein
LFSDMIALTAPLLQQYAIASSILYSQLATSTSHLPYYIVELARRPHRLDTRFCSLWVLCYAVKLMWCPCYTASIAGCTLCAAICSWCGGCVNSYVKPILYKRLF